MSIIALTGSRARGLCGRTAFRKAGDQCDHKASLWVTGAVLKRMVLEPPPTRVVVNFCFLWLGVICIFLFARHLVFSFFWRDFQESLRFHRGTL